MRRPDFFIVGAPKCGTTALYEYLRQHPAVFMPEEKEPQFYGSDLRFPWLRDEASYLSLFAAARPDEIVGEASVWYLYSRRSAREIREACPDARIIAMLRDPVSMLHSLHSNAVVTLDERLDFEEALAAEPDRKEGRRLPPRLVVPRELLYYREVVDYAPQVRRYFDAFGRDRVKVILFDDLKADTPGVYRETLDFLGLDPTFRPDFEIVNANRANRSRLIGRWTTNPPVPRFLQPVMRSVVAWPPTRRVVHRLVGALRRLNTRYEERAPMDPELRRRLRAELAPKVRDLEAALDVDLTSWRGEPDSA